MNNSTGYLPLLPGLTKLPPPFEVINDLLDEMVFEKTDGTFGYLGKGLFRQTLDAKLPNFIEEIKTIFDQ